MGERVLVIDDSSLIHDALRVRLAPENLEILHAFDGGSGIGMAREHHPNLILLDLALGEESGLSVCRRLQEDPELSSIPIMILTGTTDTENKVKCLDAGAIDYITKPFDPEELRARVRVGLRIKRYHDMLSRQAKLDAMTGLWNRGYFDERLSSELAVANRHDRPLGLLLIDIDHFKGVNDEFGHPIGDRLLRAVAESISQSIRQGSVACRLGGDEFGIIVREGNQVSLQAIGARLLSRVAGVSLRHRSGEVKVSLSIGGASRDDHKQEVVAHGSARLFALADHALYEAKRTGRGRIVIARVETVREP